MEYKIKVGGKEFVFTKVNMLISEMYSEMVQKAVEFSTLRINAEEIDNDYVIAKEEADSRVGKIKARQAQIKASRALTELSKALTKEMYDQRVLILAEILAFNGYEFDEDWWKKNADTEDLNDIVTNVTAGKKKVT